MSSSCVVQGGLLHCAQDRLRPQQLPVRHPLARALTPACRHPRLPLQCCLPKPHPEPRYERKPQCPSNKVWSHKQHRCRCPSNLIWSREKMACACTRDGSVYSRKHDKCVCRKGHRFNRHTKRCDKVKRTVRLECRAG